VRLHDDKSTYTGVYAKGGPSTVDPQVSMKFSMLGLEEVKQEKENLKPHLLKVHIQSTQPASTLEDVFLGFTGGQDDMDGKTLAKLAKDCDLIDKKFTTVDIDIIFAKVKSKGARKISPEQFIIALEEFAAKKGVSFDQLS
jgi:hypothetical protein